MTVPPDPRAQRPGLQQIGEVSVKGTLASFDSNGRIQDASSDVVFLAGLPTADPHVKNQLWSNSGVITVSAG